MTPSGVFVIPAYNPGPLLRRVVSNLQKSKEGAGLASVPVVVVDDGCTDDSIAALNTTEVTVLRHNRNRGKGAALQTALQWAQDNGFDTCVTLDADAQHPAHEAVRLFQSDAPGGSLVLAVRDLARAGAPRPSQMSNSFSNWILSLFGGEELRDTQCGLRRYPVEPTLDLGASHPGYAFESEVILRAARRGLPIVHVDTEVHYPDEAERVSHFDSVSDPAKNVLVVVRTALLVPHHRPWRRWGRRALIALLLFAGGFYARSLFT